MFHPRKKKGSTFLILTLKKYSNLPKQPCHSEKIAALMKVTLHTIQNILATYLFETFQRCNPQRNYPQNTSKHEGRYILHALQQNNDLPLRDIINKIGLGISQTTL